MKRLRCHEKTLRHERDAMPEAPVMRRPWVKLPCREQTLLLISGREKTFVVVKRHYATRGAVATG